MWNDFHCSHNNKARTVSPSPRQKTFVEVTVIIGANQEVSLEYNMPESLFDASAPPNSLLQFLIPITDSTSVESATQAAIEEARIVLGSRFHCNEEVVAQIQSETEKCVVNYFRCNSFPVCNKHPKLQALL